MSGLGNVRLGKCLSGETSSRERVRRGSVTRGIVLGEVLVGELPSRGTVRIPYQKQSPRAVFRKICSENVHAANFIYRRTPMPKCNLLNSQFDLGVLL